MYPNTTMTRQPVPQQAPQQYAPQPQAPPVEQAPEIPAPGPVQTGELDSARWASLRGKMRRLLADLTMALSDDEKGAFPIEDDSRFADGRMDMDFEESSIEYLGDIQIKALELAAVAERFRWNLMVRNHDPIAPDTTDDATDTTGQQPQA